MDEFGAAFRRVAKLLGGQRVDASAASVSRLEDRNSFARAHELAGRHQARSTSADDQDMRRMQRDHGQGIWVPSAATAF